MGLSTDGPINQFDGLGLAHNEVEYVGISNFSFYSQNAPIGSSVSSFARISPRSLSPVATVSCESLVLSRYHLGYITAATRRRPTLPPSFPCCVLSFRYGTSVLSEDLSAIEQI